ncbi:hypothetical protein EBBID32_41070 [Sphingobium indicum BiD32]|uniref:Uncharacterized protein n=1 Tax=Sphingobium indicum BiD32 TaxID=1301087 RepID=N1MW02_9SPHN|nr:hypothetical protein [Sphingobium indicum]CCW19737.1 hypothetical protein EBBID32_41070 [Sphingobium indicum BiD32]
MRKIALFALAGALALSACGKKEEEPTATNNLVEPPVENIIIEEPDAVLPPPSNNAVATPAAPPSISEQQQIQDDADATGMTARLPQEGEETQPTDEANGSAP